MRQDQSKMRRATRRQGHSPSNRGKTKARLDHKPREAGLTPLLACLWSHKRN
jgi:hypothetical protein